MESNDRDYLPDNEAELDNSFDLKNNRNSLPCKVENTKVFFHNEPSIIRPASSIPQRSLIVKLQSLQQMNSPIKRVESISKGIPGTVSPIINSITSIDAQNHKSIGGSFNLSRIQSFSEKDKKDLSFGMKHQRKGSVRLRKSMKMLEIKDTIQSRRKYFSFLPVSLSNDIIHGSWYKKLLTFDFLV